MSGSREIKFIINKQTGEIKTETYGFKGGTCDDVLNKISKQMNSTISDKKNKPERFQHLSDAETEKEKQKLFKK